MADHVNEGRSRDLVQFEPPGKNTINDWKGLRKELHKKLETHRADHRKSRSFSFLSWRRQCTYGWCRWSRGELQ